MVYIKSGLSIPQEFERAHLCLKLSGLLRPASIMLSISDAVGIFCHVHKVSGQCLLQIFGVTVSLMATNLFRCYFFLRQIYHFIGSSSPQNLSLELF